MSNTPILASSPLQGMHWPTLDPFLFCAHHNDNFPAGDARMAPKASLAGREIGSDFSQKDGWSMYHGEVAPGFPQHPHRGFETVTLARSGLVDHSDSMGATARFGRGDVQWMTAGKGVVHCEMFPLVHEDQENPTELFQIWLNLPAHHKMVDPYFTMLWSGEIPRHQLVDQGGHPVIVTTMAGSFNRVAPPPPPPDSWAGKVENNVAIWTIELGAGAVFDLPQAPAAASRVLYLFQSQEARVAGQRFAGPTVVQVRADLPVRIEATGGSVELLMLQGNPIREPVAKQGPFVMNTESELATAFSDYRRTRFGGWPWSSPDPLHARGEGRFAIHADGRRERPG